MRINDEMSPFTNYLKQFDKDKIEIGKTYYLFRFKNTEDRNEFISKAINLRYLGNFKVEQKFEQYDEDVFKDYPFILSISNTDGDSYVRSDKEISNSVNMAKKYNGFYEGFSTDFKVDNVNYKMELKAESLTSKGGHGRILKEAK